MIREIVESAENTYIINFPKELIGKKVEVIAFEIEEEKHIIPSPDPNILEDIKNRYDRLPKISHEHYKFNRDEANDFE